MENIVVTVLCFAYNHGKYIKDALDGFVNQKTNFKYEVLVHDDKSTDNTAEIIAEYAEKYPDIIKPMYEEENQYSQGKLIYKIMLPYVRGKYVATCEGDDYWCDNSKLQKQVDFMESNPDYVLCAHNTKFHNQENGKKSAIYSTKDRDIKIEDAVTGMGKCYHTSSVLYKKELLVDRPEFTSMIPGVGDYPFAVYATLQGKVKYFSDVMSVYRYMVEGSWTDKNVHDNKKAAKIYENSIKMLEAANEWSDKKYDDVFKKGILYRRFDRATVIKDYDEILSDDLKSILTFKLRFKYRLMKTLSCLLRK